MVRNLENLHRGTPNWSDKPRPMAVWGFARSIEQVPQHVLNQQLQLLLEERVGIELQPVEVALVSVDRHSLFGGPVTVGASRASITSPWNS